MAGSKNSQSTVLARVHNIYPYLLRGHDFQSLWELVSNGDEFDWSCSDKTLRRYIKKATTILESTIQREAEKELIVAIEQLKHLYFLALKVNKDEPVPTKSIMTALTVRKELNELLKLKETTINVNHQMTPAEIDETLKRFGIPIDEK